MIFSWIVSQVRLVIVEHIVRVDPSSRVLIAVEEVVDDVR